MLVRSWLSRSIYGIQILLSHKITYDDTI
ncbi:hypothetical protein XNC1_4456 [Xenorhabdus nematophila ATCC 19061]|uniref:Uncharacterized protein n=1 Tax=Xenorhabdus nematophila (strain ATCC 19061 / DSM 3370 / CCUG 14189 / LMG 1036 / NCIMB 9965 / AN6) TaxID=406817 RepID=D3VF21_XENNA|nr:hypothetical protein XNC1_4456 [Xenorhabdus nematophila ATCC 19061]CEE90945.1 hypothetical protein XNA1_1840008 [Xenorhabdus nematophila str. Anatoliense]CEE91110.1 hypothetical protein XNA1_1970008 [Xenorhabdus nematophila str. Anatoliense]CEK25294.1 hypothetical protein XNC2_4307 [Xenorhabdus nematophila AN6/1]